MNRKVIFSPDHNEQFEIVSLNGNYRIYRLNEQGKPQPVGETYCSASELVDALVELAIFSGEEESTLDAINQSIKTVANTVKEYCTLYSGY